MNLLNKENFIQFLELFFSDAEKNINSHYYW